MHYEKYSNLLFENYRLPEVKKIYMYVKLHKHFANPETFKI